VNTTLATWPESSTRSPSSWRPAEPSSTDAPETLSDRKALDLRDSLAEAYRREQATEDGVDLWAKLVGVDNVHAHEVRSDRVRPRLARRRRRVVEAAAS